MNARTFSVYLPKDLKDWLETQAKKEGRSLNNYIILILNRHRESSEAEERVPATLRRAF